MESKNNVIELDVETLKADAKAVTDATRGLKRELKSLRKTLDDAFTIGGYVDYTQTVLRYGKTLTDGLLVLQLRLGMLKSAITDAVMPLAAIFVPALNQAVLACTRFFRGVGGVLSALLLSKKATQGLANSTDTAAKGQQKLKNAAASAGKAMQKSLAPFDEINRLAKQGGGAGAVEISKPEPPMPQMQDTLSPQLQAIVDKILYIFEPLRSIDFSPLSASLDNLSAAFGRLWAIIGEQMEWVWFNILVPLGTWTIEELAPASLDVLSAALDLLAAVIQPVWEGICQVAETLSPFIEYIKNIVVEVLGIMREKIQSLTGLIQEKGPKITEIIQAIGSIFGSVWAAIEPILSFMLEKFRTVFDGIWHLVETAIGTVIDLLYHLTGFLSAVFTGDFEKAWECLGGLVSTWLSTIGSLIWDGFSGIVQKAVSVFMSMGEKLGEIFGWTADDVKGLANGIIGFINGMVSGVISGINAMIRALNRVKFDIPSWVPGLGGKSFGFHISTLSTPRIPYLAQGAVLPANKPFLAMVGDQKHGTNVEAPLSTIQEAVAAVMGDQTAAILAGFEASVGVQKEILEAVLGICIGDDVIGNAVARYTRKQSIITGGAL